MSKADARVRDRYLHYPGFTPESWGICHLRLIPSPGGALLIASEIRHNPGPSVTNAIEGIWAAIREQISETVLGPRPLLVEHYNDRAVYGEPQLGERLALVGFEAGKTTWRRVLPREIVALSGCAPEDVVVPLERLILTSIGETP